ncbi:MAG: hypothetical protein EP330_20405 [Deltaproteobacteria bacterium]|nr:MAG: hypothetical protein EP330_20405 [Deltaproteobacteria bacterium]
MRTITLVSFVLLTACAGSDEPDPDFTLDPGFGDDTRGPFSSAGEVEDTTCGAWFPTTAQHQVTLTENFLALHFMTDTVDAPFKVIEGNNTWCSDTDSTPLPVVSSGAWSGGTFAVYVGSPTEGGSTPYDLTVAEGLPDGM